jgi:hypothetical protein
MAKIGINVLRWKDGRMDGFGIWDLGFENWDLILKLKLILIMKFMSMED